MFTKKITFSNVSIIYGGCDCCGDGNKVRTEAGPYEVWVRDDGDSVDNHAVAAFGPGLVAFDHVVGE